MKYWAYMTANKPNGVIYIGQTHELKDRIYKHKTKKHKNAFTARYNVDKLVWFEEYNSIFDARVREKQLKAGSRAKKVKLIEAMNPEWRDLFDTLT